MERSIFSATDHEKQITYCQRDNAQLPIFFRLLPMLVKIGAVSCEVNMT